MAHSSRILQRCQTFESLNVRWLCYKSHTKEQRLSFSTCRPGSRCAVKKPLYRDAAIRFHSSCSRTVSNSATALIGSARLEMKGDHLLMKDGGGDSDVKLPYYWLRDNCRCSTCFHPDTYQVLHNIADLNLDIRPTDVQSDGYDVTISWNDDHKSVFSCTWLRDNAPGFGNEEDLVHRTLWQGSHINMPSFQVSDLYNDKPTLKKILQTLHEYGVALIGGVGTSSEAHGDVVNFVAGGIQSSFYGLGVCSLSPGLDNADTAYTNVAISLHTDTTYFSPPCRGMSIQISERSGEGGESIFCDGFYALEKLRSQNPEYFQILCDTPITAQFLDEGRNIRNSEPIVKINQNTKQIERIRFNAHDRVTITNLPNEDMLNFYKAYQALAKEIYHEENAFKILLEPDQVVMYDNWRVLHAREAFTGHRVAKTSYLRHDDWMSQMRTIGELEV